MVREKIGRKFEFEIVPINLKSSSSIETTLSEAASNKKPERDSNPGQSGSEAARPSAQRPPGSVPRGSTRPTSTRNLTSMLKKEAKASEPSNTSGKYR